MAAVAPEVLQVERIHTSIHGCSGEDALEKRQGHFELTSIDVYVIVYMDRIASNSLLVH